MKTSSVNQSAPIAAVDTLSKMAKRDPKGMIIGVLVVFCFVFLYGWHRAEARKDEMVDTYNVLIFGLVRQVDKNAQDIGDIKTRKSVEDSLQNK